jgi:hypothetical protein
MNIPVEATAEEDIPALAYQVIQIDPECVERHFYRVEDVLIFRGEALAEIRSAAASAEELLANPGRKGRFLLLQRGDALVEMRMERGAAGLLLEACLVPDEIPEIARELPWTDIFKDERRFYPLLAEGKSFLALAFPVIYFLIAGAWRQLAIFGCFYAVAALVSPLFVVVTYALLSYLAYASGPELVAADYRYYERKIWARLRAADPASIKLLTDPLLQGPAAAPKPAGVPAA